MTSNVSNFCTQCGAALHAGSRFCGQCGSAVQAPPTAPPPYAPPAPPPSAPAPPAAAVEPIVGVVAGLQRRKGMLGMRTDNYNLIVTPARLVLAYMTPQMMQQAIATARQEARQEGRGLLGQVAAQMGWIDVVCRGYADVPVETIARQYPGSMVFWNAEIRRIRLRRMGNEEQGYKQQLVIESSAGKHHFELRGTDAGTARRLLRQTLGAVVK